jgi:heme/copper-type cytochrome/quinol oxidase subunit 4
VATSSGEALEKHVGDPGRHAQLGDQLIWFALPLLVLVVAVVLVHHRGLPGLRVLGTLALVAAVAAGVQVYRVGDSGARAAWGDQVSSAGR